MRAVGFRVRALVRRYGRAWIAIALVFGVVAGVALGLTQAARATNRVYPDFVRNEKAADLVMAGQSSFGLVGSVDLKQLAATSTLVDDAAQAFVVLPFSATLDDGRRFGIADMFPIASTDGKLGRDIEQWKMVEGRAADPQRADEATASFVLARRLNLHPGDTLLFHFYAASKFFGTQVQLLTSWKQRLAAIADGHPVAPHDAANGLQFRVVITGIEASPAEIPPLLTDLSPVLHLTHAFATDFGTNIVQSPIAYIKLAQRSDLQRFQLAAERVAKGKPVSFISSLNNQSAKVQRSLRAEALVLGLLAILIGVAGAIALAQALVRETFSETRDDATLGALGMTRGQLLVISMTRALVIGGATAAVACLAAWWLAPYFLLSLARTVSLQTGHPVDGALLVAGAAIVVGFAVVVGTLAALLARRDRRERVPGSHPLVRAAGHAALPLSMALGVRFALQRARRAAPAWTTIAGVASCAAMLAFAITFTDHLQRDLSQPHRYGWNWDLKLGAPGLPDLLQDVLTPELKRQPGITDLSVGAVIQADVGPTRVDVLALEPQLGNAIPTINAGDAPAGPDEVALGARTMRTLHTHIGGRISAQVGSTKAEYRVVGQAVFPEFGDSGQLGTGAFMTIDGVRRINPSAPRNTFLMKFAGPGAATERKRVVTALEPLPARTDARPEDLVNLAHGEGLLGVLALVLGVLALAMLVHALFTSVQASRRQHAILRALGFTRRGNRRIVRWQSLTLALIAALIGLPIGVIAGRRAWVAYAGRLGVVADPFVPVTMLLLGLGAAAVIAVVAAIVPGWVETRVRVGAALRSPE